MLSNHDKEHNKTFHFDLKNRPTHSQEVDCLEARGTYGRWEQDLEYSSRVQYIPIMGFRQKKHKRQQNKRLQQGLNTSFLPQRVQAWKETRFPQCSFQIMTRQGFCFVLQKLGIQNVYMAGDSMMQAMYISLLGLLGFTKGLEYGAQIDCLGMDSVRLYFDRTIYLLHSSTSGQQHYPNRQVGLRFHHSRTQLWTSGN